MKFEESLESGPHARLKQFIGEWTGPTSTWFEPDVLADESPMTGTIRPVLGGRFLIHEYRGSLQGKPFEGIAIYGFDLATRRWQSAWIDSFHMSTGFLFSEGEAGDTLNVLGSYFVGEEQPRWGWRTVIEAVDDDNIVITAYNITPTGEEAKGTETRYTRKV